MLPHLLSRVINVPLAIEPGKLEVILEVLNQKIRGSTEDRVALIKSGEDYKTPAMSFIFAPFGEKELRHAIIPVYGSLVQRTRGLGTLSGLTSYDRIRKDMEEALDDPDVVGITLEIDSPGGEIAGLFDLVDFIYESRGRKPITAFINEAGFSAAYAIASAADKIVMPKTGGVGSIGVIAVHVDQSKFDEKMGLKYTPVFAGARKNDFSAHSPLSDEALARLQAIVNDHYELFVETVARNRGLSTRQIKETEAGLFFGQEAIDVKLADELRPYNDYVKGAKMSNENKEQNTMLEGKDVQMNAETNKPETEMKKETENEQAEAQKDKVVDIKEAAKKLGAKEERERQFAINRMCKSVGKLLSEEAIEKIKGELIETGATVDRAREVLLEAIVKETSKEEIISTVGALSTGEVNPVIAEAKKRAERARKEA